MEEKKQRVDINMIDANMPHGQSKPGYCSRECYLADSAKREEQRNNDKRKD